MRGKETSREEETNVLNPSKGQYALVKNDGFRWRDGEDFSYKEAKFWCTAILMSGSSVILSDRLAMLNEAGLELIRKTVQYADFEQAVPVNVGAELPYVWFKQSNGALYILNFDQIRRTYQVNLHSLGKISIDRSYIDIFTGKKFEIEKGMLTVTLEGKDSIALYCKFLKLSHVRDVV